MLQNRANIIEQLRKDVLLQRFSTPRSKVLSPVLFKPFAEAFPNSQFPLGVIHEFICANNESFSASSGFVSGIISSLMQQNGVTVWISNTQKMFPPSFTLFNIRPDKLIFITLDNAKDILWTMEEALKCEGLSAVICDVRELSFKQSRRLQLATEKSRVTGFVLRNAPRYISTTACATRWTINPTISRKINDMPGIGYPSWNVDLLKVKNGKPGSWKISWHAGKFIHMQDQSPAITIHQKQAV